jgi:nitrate reductase gamma subunit
LSALTILYALLFYAAMAMLVGGVARKCWVYARTPQPLKIPIPPAPATRRGVALRMLVEATLFKSLFRSNKWIWLFGWLFHVALLAVLLRHLRYFTEPVWGWVALIQPFGLYAGFALLAGLAGLWARRFLVDRVRYISSPSDHLMLALLVAIAASGLAMKFVAHTDIVALKAFFLGLMAFDWQPLPADPLLLLHLGLVATLMIVFPLSKLLHAPGVFFSPSLNQVDDARERRHAAGWSARIVHVKRASIGRAGTARGA